MAEKRKHRRREGTTDRAAPDQEGPVSPDPEKLPPASESNEARRAHSRRKDTLPLHWKDRPDMEKDRARDKKTRR